MEETIETLKAKIAELEGELEQERAEREEVVEKLDQCTQFAIGLKKQRDEAILLTEQLIEAAQKQDKKIILPGHVDSTGKPKIII